VFDNVVSPRYDGRSPSAIVRNVGFIVEKGFAVGPAKKSLPDDNPSKLFVLWSSAFIAVLCRLDRVAYACVPDVSTVITLVALPGFAAEGFLITSPEEPSG